MSRFRFRSKTPPEWRFWPKVAFADGDQCWAWIAQRDPDGYGRFRLTSDKSIFAHRFAWVLAYGAVPDGLCVCHHCDNPSCVRPDHLFVATNLGNVADRDRKGRTAAGERHPHWGKRKPKQLILALHTPPPHRPGMLNGRAVLTDNEVRAIRADPRIYPEIAVEYSVTRGTVGHIKRGLTWKHVY